MLGVGPGLACSDRTTKEDEVAQRLCTAFCEKYEECDLPPETPSVEECVEACTGYEWTWGKACRAEYIATYECVTRLSCENFAITDHIVEGEASCTAEQDASGLCTSHNGGIPPDGG